MQNKLWFIFISEMQPTKKNAVFLACVGNNDYLCILVMKRTEDEYYIESKRIRNEVLAMAEALKEHPLHYKKELRFNKSLADSNGALVLNGA